MKVREEELDNGKVIEVTQPVSYLYIDMAVY